MVAEGNVGTAFGLVAAAGMATCLGACIVFCANLAQPRLLAGSLGFAAGVMLYVSFAEILMRKSVAGFQAGVNTSGDVAFRWATLCFFGGMAIIAVLDRVVHAIAHWGASHSMRKAGAQRSAGANTSTANLLSHEDQWAARRSSRHAPAGAGAGASADGRAGALPPALAVMQRNSGGGAGDGQTTGRRDVEELGSAANTPRARDSGDAGSASDSDDGDMEGRQAALSSPVPSLTEPCDAMTSAVVAASCPDTVVASGTTDEGRGKAGGGDGEGEGAGRGAPGAAGGATTSRTPPAVVEIMEADHHSFMLKKMGLMTALAIFIHNFPEGLATFVGALADTKVGVGLAVAIAMHNIPEGICVAMPIYYATGSKWKGFMWALLSGLSEPVGALVGYLALSGGSDLSFAIVFGLVAGMMVYISVKELIPTALRYDPKDSVATTSVIAGMVVMAASLLLFTI